MTTHGACGQAGRLAEILRGTAVSGVHACRRVAGMGLVMVWFVVSLSAAEPCTLYKAADIANARENLRRYPWARAILARWRRQVAPSMAHDRAFFDELIPTLTPWTSYGNNCPACVGKKSTMGEVGVYRWSIEHPDRLVCRYCGTPYPNEKYPETGRLTCPRLGQEFSYYETEAERAHPEDHSGKNAFRWANWPVHSSWSGLIRYRKAQWAAGQVPVLAKLYALTGEVAYAERCAWIMDRFARCYPHWLYHSYDGTFADCPPAEAAAEIGRHPRAGHFSKDVIINPFGLHRNAKFAYLNVGFWGAGRFATGSGEGSMLLNMTVAYDLIRGAKRADGTPVLSPESEARIVQDLILAGCRDRENWSAINNKAGPNRALSAAVGILFERPASAHRAWDGLERILEECFHRDGFCRESPSYSGMHLSLMADIPLILRGYSDPPGYVPRKGKPFRNFDPFHSLPRYRLALESMVRMAAPNQRPPVLGDTHYRAGLSSWQAETLACWYGASYVPLLETLQGGPLRAKGGEYALWYRPADLAGADDGDSSPAALPLHTEWFPDWHVAVLRGGRPHGPTALYLNGYAWHGHRHEDTLGLVYYAFGRELASDRGYIWDDPRNAWTRSTLCHNLVTVDDQNQIRSGRKSTLLLFGRSSLVEVVEAAANAYAQCGVYRRACALVPLGGDQAYVVDVFRVEGGARHSYGMQCNGELAEVDGVDLAPLKRSHKWLSNFRAGSAAGPVVATWRDGDIRFSMLLLSTADQIVVADAPGWRSDKGSEQNAPPIQQVFAERRASSTAAGLRSTFVSVLVAYRDALPVRSAKLLRADGGVVAVRVVTREGEDTLVFVSDRRKVSLENLTLNGRFAFVRKAPDVGPSMFLLDGDRLEVGKAGIALAASFDELPVSAIEGRTYVLRRPVPGGRLWQGQYVLAGDTGFEVESVEGNRITVRDYPALPATSVRLVPSACVCPAKPKP